MSGYYPEQSGKEEVMIKIILIAVGLLVLAFAGMGIRLLLDRNAEFSGGSCQASSDKLSDKGISCGCSGVCVNEMKSS